MAIFEASVIRDCLHFGECPRWHEGRLWYSDFYDGAVHALTPSGVDERIVEVTGRPSGLGWLPDGSMLVVSQTDRRVLRQTPSGGLVEHADLWGIAPFHCNDMVVDENGTAYVGNFGFDFDAYLAEHGGPALFTDPSLTTVVVRVDVDGSVSVAADDLRFPNGMVLTADGRTIVIAETLAMRLTAFDIDDDGALSNRRVWADLAHLGAAPDGICLDAEGAVWVANAAAAAALRVAEGGEVLDQASFSQRCFACMLGGADRNELYAMTAPSSNATTASAAAYGRIESVTVPVPGDGRP